MSHRVFFEKAGVAKIHGALSGIAGETDSDAAPDIEPAASDLASSAFEYFLEEWRVARADLQSIASDLASGVDAVRDRFAAAELQNIDGVEALVAELGDA